MMESLINRFTGTVAGTTAWSPPFPMPDAPCPISGLYTSLSMTGSPLTADSLAAMLTASDFTPFE